MRQFVTCLKNEQPNKPEQCIRKSECGENQLEQRVLKEPKT